jgi:hypothetical protein
MRDNNFTDKQLRGINLAINAAKRKYPFIVGWDFIPDYEKYDVTLYINLKVNLKKMADYLGETTYKEYYENVEKFGAILAPFDWGEYGTEDWEKFGEKSYKFGLTIADFINSAYEQLPEDFKIYYDLSHPFKYLTKIKPDYYIPAQ